MFKQNECKSRKNRKHKRSKIRALTIEAEKFDEAMKKVYAKTAKYFNIPGFRKGKAPMQYGGKTIWLFNFL